jgi:hypothetical protein
MRMWARSTALVIDAEDGLLAYAVLSLGGFLGMGNKLFAMPWKAFEFHATDRKLIIAVKIYTR